MKKLQMSLKQKWFDMTKAKIKKEDYREITPYWIKRLFGGFDETDTLDVLNDICYDLKTFEYSMEEIWTWLRIKPKKFDVNIMTLGYPKATDADRILTLKHEGIEIRKGNTEWGADHDKRYFVIKHGELL